MTGQDAVTPRRLQRTHRLRWRSADKLDGDTRGGAALSIKYQVGKPIKFRQYGER